MSAGDAPRSLRLPSRGCDELAALERAYSPGHHGLWSARRRAELVDAALVELYGAETSAASGRRARRWSRSAATGAAPLLPGSDVDLLLLHDGDGAGGRRRARRSACSYPLWDAGFTVGHAVRTPAEMRRAGGRTARRRDRRCSTRVCSPGDAACCAEALDPVVDAAARRPGRVRRAPGERRAASGASASARAAYLLEPELKEGGGGLRDIARRSAGSRRSAAGRSRTPGCSGAPNATQLDAAEEFLTRVRSALHLESGRKRGPAAPGSAARRSRGRWGSRTSRGCSAADGLMRAVFEHARARGRAHRRRDHPTEPDRRAVRRSAVELADAAEALALVAS